MNIISAYEQGYISLDYFKQNFLDWVSESLECCYGENCVDFYADLSLGKQDCHYYVKKYGVGLDGDIAWQGYQDKNNQISDQWNPFG